MTLADTLGMALDPVLMAERVGLDLDPWQRDVLRSADQQIIMLVTRQGGKSTVSSLLALHQALYAPGSLVLLLSPTLRQSGELYAKVKGAYDALGRPVPAIKETELTLALANGSRIVSLPGTEGTIRGYSGVSLLVIDEASRVDDALYAAVRPMLAVSGGRIVALSTPWGRRGWFFEAWERGEDWRRFRITAEQCPRIPADWLEREKRAIGSLMYRQEYGCEFVETEASLYSYESIEAAASPSVQPLLGGKVFIP